MFKIKDKKALIFYLVATILLWQFGATLAKLCTDVYAQICTKDNPIFSFVYATNTGGAFSIFSNSTCILSTLGFVALVLIVFYVARKVTFENKFTILYLTLFSAGILGNLYERMTLGHVVDYVKLNFVNFAIFNSFDVMITFGVVLCFCTIFCEEFKNWLKKCQK